MFSFMHKTPSLKQEVYPTVQEGLRSLYHHVLHPVEDHILFSNFHSPPLEHAAFTGKPMVLLIGQYSTGKTTFIKYLMEQDVLGTKVGPEPTTDTFHIISSGHEEKMITGHNLVMNTALPFTSLSKFGNSFLTRLVCTEMANPVLDTITLIDTPGVIAGEPNNAERGYEFAQVIEWFAERVSRIILMFDASKLDICDELKECIEVMRPYQDKIRIILNKADMVTTQQLMRIYGALTWTLGKTFNTQQVVRVYIGSFWHQPLIYHDNSRLFELEHTDLFNDLRKLPTQNTVRKLHDFIRRVRMVKVHALIMAKLKKIMPLVLGKDTKKKEILSTLADIFKSIQMESHVNALDFPDTNRMRHTLNNYDFSKFPNINPVMMDGLEKLTTEELPKLMALMEEEEKENHAADVHGGIFDMKRAENPFSHKSSKDSNSEHWIIDKTRRASDEIFASLCPDETMKLTSDRASTYMKKSNLPNMTLARIWELADVDHDGMLDCDEWALACYLMTLPDYDCLPKALPDHLIPPSKRHKNTESHHKRKEERESFH